MARPTKRDQAKTARKRARDQVKEKGVYVRQVTDDTVVYDVSVTCDGKRKTKRVVVSSSAPQKEKLEAIEAARKELSEAAKESARVPFSDHVEHYIRHSQMKASTAIQIRRYLAGFGYDAKENVRLFEDLRDSDYKPSTKRVRIKAIRTFFTTAKREGWIDLPDPTNGFHPKEGKPRTRIPTDAEITTLLLRTQEKHDALFLRLLIDTGARCSTLLALRPCDMDDDWRLSLYNVKMDRKYRVKFPITGQTTRVLWKSITEYMKPDAKIFEQVHCNRLKHRMRHWFGKDADGQTISPHSFRHRMATMLSADKQPVGLIAELLDASPAVLVRTYTNFGQADVDNLFFDETTTPDYDGEVETKDVIHGPRQTKLFKHL